jgi:hypothetical protein
MSFGITSLVLTERKYIELQQKVRNGENIKESEKEMLQLFKELNYSKCTETNIINFFDLLREVIAEENVKK